MLCRDLFSLTNWERSLLTLRLLRARRCSGGVRGLLSPSSSLRWWSRAALMPRRRRRRSCRWASTASPARPERDARRRQSGACATRSSLGTVRPSLQRERHRPRGGCTRRSAHVSRSQGLWLVRGPRRPVDGLACRDGDRGSGLAAAAFCAAGRHRDEGVRDSIPSLLSEYEHSASDWTRSGSRAGLGYRLLRIDPSSGEVRGLVPTGFAEPYVIAAGEGAVWAVAARKQSVDRLLGWPGRRRRCSPSASPPTCGPSRRRLGPGVADER